MVPAFSLNLVMPKTIKRIVFGLSILLVAAAFLGTYVPDVRAGSSANGAYPEMEVYSEVLRKIQTDYVVTPDIKDVTTGALHGLLGSLDADSSYLTPTEYKLYKEHEGEQRAQVGLYVSKRYGYATVVAVEPGSPAASQRIQDGDIIEAIEGHTTREMSLAMIRLRLEGKPGTTVTFALVRPRSAKPDTITLTRAFLKPPPLGEREYAGNSVLYLKPGILTKARVDEIASRIKAMPKDGNKKICLDLRDVAEGPESEGILLANFFLKSGVIATLSGQKFPTKTFSADPQKFLTSAPLVILVNHGTSGAAEITAAAILDHKRGDVVGDPTFGEGSVQRTMPLSDGAALILTIAKYASPSGTVIQDDAVTPNYLVAEAEQFADESAAAKADQPDNQLNKALELLKQQNPAGQKSA